MNFFCRFDGVKYSSLMRKAEKSFFVNFSKKVWLFLFYVEWFSFDTHTQKHTRLCPLLFLQIFEKLLRSICLLPCTCQRSLGYSKLASFVQSWHEFHVLLLCSCLGILSKVSSFKSQRTLSWWLPLFFVDNLFLLTLPTVITFLILSLSPALLFFPATLLFAQSSQACTQFLNFLYFCSLGFHASTIC